MVPITQRMGLADEEEVELAVRRHRRTTDEIVLENVVLDDDDDDNDGDDGEDQDLLLHSSEDIGLEDRRTWVSAIRTLLARGCLIAGPTSFVCFVLASPRKDVRTGGLVCWVALWWVTEVVPIGISAFIPALVLPLIGVSRVDDVCAVYFSPVIMLFLQSFMIASAVRRCQLHRRVALNVLMVTGTAPGGILLGSIGITAFLSMWMSNTATSAMMVPLVLTLYESLFHEDESNTRATRSDTHTNAEYTGINGSGGDGGGGVAIGGSGGESPRRTSSAIRPRGGGKGNGKGRGKERQVKRFGQALMLSVAYGASIGGVATLVGTGPNLILAETWKKTFDASLAFPTWFGFGLSYALCMLGILYVVLYLGYTTKDLPKASNDVLRGLLDQLGPFSWSEGVVSSGIVCVVALWLTRKSPLLGWGDALHRATGGHANDYMPAMAAVIAFFIIPARAPWPWRCRGAPGPRPGEAGEAGGPPGKILDVGCFTEVSWGVVFLMGGGFALSLGVRESGLMEDISEALGVLHSAIPRFLHPLVIASLVVRERNEPIGPNTLPFAHPKLNKSSSPLFHLVFWVERIWVHNNRAYAQYPPRSCMHAHTH